MTDIRQWLENLGLGQYADAFEENDIELQFLTKLDDTALEKLGVASMGHRLKLLDAIETNSDADSATGDADGSVGNSEPQLPLDAERRQITIMFCDLVGSTALSEKLDPEDLRSLMQMYRKAAGEIIERYDGHVAQYLGDGLMVYFGWPTAHEDDAERAVRAGLEIIGAVKDVTTKEPLQVRIGVATGQVVVGEGSDETALASKLAVGETPNVAARVQALADPDHIVLAPTTRRLTGGAFDYESLGERTLKGVIEPVHLWRVLGESQIEVRFEAQDVGALTPLVGRETELAMLLERW